VQAIRSYWSLSRAPRYSITFALPLLLLYEALAATLSRFAGEQMRNGADVMLRSLFISVAGRRGLLLFVLCVIAVSIWLIARDLRRSGKLSLASSCGCRLRQSRSRSSLASSSVP
jgi:hypothetical protein